MSQIFLYLPSGYLISEKLLYLLKFEKQQLIQVKFFKPIHKSSPEFFIQNTNLENLSINKMKFEDIKNNDSQDISDYVYYKSQTQVSRSSQNSNNQSQDSIEYNEFKKNRTINENLSKKKLKNQSQGSKNNQYLKIDHPSLIVDQQIVCSDFVSIVVYFLKNVEFVDKIQTLVDQKFLNLLNFIQIYFDQVLQFLMSIIYYQGVDLQKQNNKVFQLVLKIFHDNLTYFENYFLEEDAYLFNSQFSFIDLSMLVILKKAFGFLLGEKIRKKTFPNLLIWLKKKNFYFYEELCEFKLTQFCKIAYNDQFFTCDNRIFHLKENSHKEIWTFGLFKQEFQKLLKRRNFCITQNSIFKLSSQQYQSYKFQLILTETDSDDNQFINNQKEIQKFQKRLETKIQDLQNKICIYQILYSKCEEETFYIQTEESIQMCSKHYGRYFKNLNLCGLIFYEGTELPDEVLQYESSDEIHLEQIKISISDLFYQIYNREKQFSFEKVFNEIII